MSSDFQRFNWIPARTAARMLGVSRQRVYQLIADGKIGSVTLDGVFFVSRSTVESRIIWLRKLQLESANRPKITEEGVIE